MKVLVIAALALLASGCNLLSNDSSSPTSPSGNTTSTFSGTVPLQQASFVAFTTAASGTVSLTLTSVSPTPTSGIGLGIGTPSGTSCTLTTFTNSASVSTSAQITASVNAGTYCAQVYDPGNLAAATTFSVSISHP
jgi:hypothetical protein